MTPEGDRGFCSLSFTKKMGLKPIPVNLTGVGDPYEPPLNPELICQTDVETIGESVAKVLQAVLAELT